MFYDKIKTILVCYRNIRHYSKSINKLKPPWKILFFGTDNFSLSSLQALNYRYKQNNIISKLEVVTTIKNKPNAIYKFASKEKLKIHPWPIIPMDGFHIGLVVSFGYLIPQNIINSFPLGMLNVHASLLPRWRGAAPIIHAIANGDERTGITIMTIKPKHFDIGNIVRQQSVLITDSMVLPELYKLLADLGSEVLMEELSKLPENLCSAKPQPNIGITLAPKVTIAFGHLNWNIMTATNIYNLSRALHDLYPLCTKWGDLIVKLYNVKLSSMEETNSIRPGAMHYDKGVKLLKVQCCDGNWISVANVGVRIEE
ncbi:methionyl-trna formyltransferase [Holotrichia oblita]|uniref:Methionyl-trna formyltransferase n=1 Tax=Holotrichia oblita TaxID=644536 RepID=A0ACB9SWW5_HOLOL|nr:methionyl-trna formyltransferase [Holotrichia oblita]